MANLLNISTFLYYGMTTLSFASGACVIMFRLSALTSPKVSPFIWELLICRFFRFWAKCHRVSLISRSTLIYRNMVCMYHSFLSQRPRGPLPSLSHYRQAGVWLSLIFLYDVDHACTQMNIVLYASTGSMEWRKNELDFVVCTMSGIMECGKNQLRFCWGITAQRASCVLSIDTWSSARPSQTTHAYTHVYTLLPFRNAHLTSFTHALNVKMRVSLMMSVELVGWAWRKL